jgi:hypothetical protein
MPRFSTEVIGGLVLLVGPLRQDGRPWPECETQSECPDAREATIPSERKTDSTIWSMCENGHQDWSCSFMRNLKPLHSCPAFLSTRWSNLG